MTPTQWTHDRQYRWIVLILLILVYAVPSLPTNLVFDAESRKILENDPTSGIGVGFKLLWMPPLLVSIGLLYLRGHLLLVYAQDFNKPLWLLLIWGLMSSLWAPSAGGTFKQAFSIMNISLIATAVCCASWQPWKIETTLRHLTTAMLLASLVVGAAIPAIGVHNENQFELLGSWRGITYQKNGLGQLAAVGIILWSHVWITGRVKPWLGAVGVALSALLVLLARSSTSLLLGVLSSLVLVSMLRTPLHTQGHSSTIWYLLAVVILSPLLAYMVIIGSFNYLDLAQPFGELFGKDATFSGRTDIWGQLFIQIGNHPFLGAGFNSFWTADNPEALMISKKLMWNVPNGHNGYIDLLNELGFIGFFLLITFLVFHFRDCARLSTYNRPAASLHVVLMLYAILANLTETGWFHPIGFTHVVAAISSAVVSRMLFEQRLKAYQTDQT
jgi:O-antigen ligase